MNKIYIIIPHSMRYAPLKLACDGPLDPQCRQGVGNTMKTTMPDTPISSTETADITPTTLFNLLANDRRRYVLHYLSQTAGAVSLCDLAEQIARWEDDSTYDRYKRILTGLHHMHLPKLVDAGMVCYNVEGETVELLDAADAVMPHLNRVTADDLE